MNILTTNQALTNLSRTGTGQETTTIPRRTLIGGAMAALLASRRAMAEDERDIAGNPFILLLKGLYQSVPAGHGPNLGLSSVNLNDGTYAKTKIYPVFK